jgi:hypothetical protein
MVDETRGGDSPPAADVAAGESRFHKAGQNHYDQEDERSGETLDDVMPSCQAREKANADLAKRRPSVTGLSMDSNVENTHL